jgi:ketosteroid isomerase-like protein
MSRITRNAAPAPVLPKAAPVAPVEVAATAPPAAGWAAKGVSAVKPSAPAPDAGKVADAFFTAFAKKDLATFEKLYAPNATFHDPIYDLKNSGETLRMWKSLFAAGKDLKLSYKVLESNGDTAKVAWTADYKVFGRPVHNEAVSNLTVKDGQIVAQRDDWSWSKWAKQALPLGPLVDFPPVKAALRFFMQRA